VLDMLYFIFYVCYQILCFLPFIKINQLIKDLLRDLLGEPPDQDNS